MTVSSALNRKEYTGDDATVAFATSPVVFFDESDLEVYLVVTATGVATLQTITTHYTVSGGAGSTGTVTMLTAPTSLQTLVIVRTMAITQATDLVNNDASDAEVQEDAFDKLTMIAQQLDAKIERSFKLADSDISSASTELPTPEASALIGWSSAGDELQNYTATALDLALTTAFALTLLDDATAAAARTTLDVPSNAEAVLDTIFDAAGDILVATAADTPAIKAVGVAGTVLMSRAAETSKLAYVAALNKGIYGLTYANNSGDATNDLDIAAGGAMDATGAYWMTGAALTKQSDVAWAVGTAAGGLDTGAVGNSDYYIWLIARSDTGVVDVLFSLSSTAPTMPTNYDFKRLVGWFKRVGGTIVAFTTYEAEGGGIELSWNVPTLDVNLASTLTTSRRTDAVKVPLNFSVTAHINVFVDDATSGQITWISCPDHTDAAPSASAAPLYNIRSLTTSSFGHAFRIRTSATGTIAARSSLATVDLYAVSTMGFTWARRN
jgi:hypothetical protein